MSVIDKIGRKKILLFGQVGMFIVLGMFGYGLLSGNIGGYWLVALLVAYIAFFAASQGAVVWVLLSEMFPNIIRARGASVGSLANWMVSAALNFLFPVVIGIFGTSQAAQQLGLSYAFIFLAVVTFIGFVYLKKYIIETKGKTLEQIEKEVLC
jgi:MFS family permease